MRKAISRCGLGFDRVWSLSRSSLQEAGVTLEGPFSSLSPTRRQKVRNSPVTGVPVTDRTNGQRTTLGGRVNVSSAADGQGQTRDIDHQLQLNGFVALAMLQ